MYYLAKWGKQDALPYLEDSYGFLAGSTIWARPIVLTIFPSLEACGRLGSSEVVLGRMKWPRAAYGIHKTLVVRGIRRLHLATL